jgi:Rod binding domain-containing protein
MNAIAPVCTMSPLGPLGGLERQVPMNRPAESPTKAAFQDFVAGTFYKEMLKSLHKMHDKPAYFHGGQAEKIFQGQLDQQVAEDLARGRGGELADSLYQAFLQNGRR